MCSRCESKSLNGVSRAQMRPPLTSRYVHETRSGWAASRWKRALTAWIGPSFPQRRPPRSRAPGRHGTARAAAGAGAIAAAAPLTQAQRRRTESGSAPPAPRHVRPPPRSSGQPADINETRRHRHSRRRHRLPPGRWGPRAAEQSSLVHAARNSAGLKLAGLSYLLLGAGHSGSSSSHVYASGSELQHEGTRVGGQSCSCWSDTQISRSCAMTRSRSESSENIARIATSLASTETVASSSAAHRRTRATRDEDPMERVGAPRIGASISSVVEGHVDGARRGRCRHQLRDVAVRVGATRDEELHAREHGGVEPQPSRTGCRRPSSPSQTAVP